MLVVGVDFGTGNSVLAAWRGQQGQLGSPCDFLIEMPSDVLANDAGVIDPDPGHLSAPLAGYRRTSALKRMLLTLGSLASTEEQEAVVRQAVARLSHLYGLFQNAAGAKVAKAVLTCPANTGQSYRELLLEIGRRVGLPEVDVVDEPTAAAVHHGLAEVASRYERWLVMDWGCGTCDVSLIERRKGHADLEVKIVKE